MSGMSDSESENNEGYVSEIGKEERQPFPTAEKTSSLMHFILNLTRKARFISFIFGVLVTSGTVLAVFLVNKGELLRPVVIDTGVQNKLSAMEASFGEMQQFVIKVQRLERQIANLSENLALLSEDFTAYETENALNKAKSRNFISALENDPRFVTMRTDIERLQRTIDGAMRPVLEGSFRSGEGLLLAVGQLRLAIARGEPYSGEWALVAAIPNLSPKVRQALEDLEVNREQGVTTEVELKRSFPELARSLIMAEASSNGSGWRDQMLLKIRKVISIRPIGASAAGNDAGALTARAEAHLLSGDIDEATKVIEYINDERGLASSWLRTARDRVEVNLALEELTVEAIALMNSRSRDSINRSLRP